ncbi:MAG: hypothetical protein KJ077_27740 [Anaerolineae bacterium]|nr:hypothetical protein [Anaerolineae bacterium]
MSERYSPEQLRELGYTLHQLLLDGDVTASAQIAEIFMPLVIEHLRRRYPQLHDPDLIDSAVIDTLINYFARPEQYDPTKLTLVGFLRMAANGDLLNLLKRSRKEIKGLHSGKIVELDASTTEHEVEIPDGVDLEATTLNQYSPVWEWLPRLLPDLIDQEIVLLMLEGIRETDAYAEVLGISDHLPEEQAAVVKRKKDQLKKKLQRNIQRSELSKND